MDIQLKKYSIPDIDSLHQLYRSVQWGSYTDDLIRLKQSLLNSLCVISAWSDHQLVGLIRTVGDGETIVYIQDILVHPDFQHQGIGRRLMVTMLEEYQGVRQIVLICDDDTGNHSFYQSCGFRQGQTYNCSSYMILRNV